MKALYYFDRYRLLQMQDSVLSVQNEDICLTEHADALNREQLEKIRAEMREIELAIQSYVPPRLFGKEKQQAIEEQLFLQCRYLRGLTLEKTAEALHVSRDTVYRIRRRIAAKDLPSTALPYILR